MRFGVFSLLLSIALSVGFIHTYDYVVDIQNYGNYGSYYDIALRAGNCTQDAINIFFWLQVPAIQGSCVPSGNCTGPTGYQLNAGSLKCTGTDQCCFLYQTQTPPTPPTMGTFPTVPSMPTAPAFPNMTAPSMPTFPNITAPSMPTFPNVTAPQMPSMPTAPSMPTVPSMPTFTASYSIHYISN